MKTIWTPDSRFRRRGVQVFLATHSLFLLRELQMLDEDEAADIRYFGLDRTNGGLVAVTQADDLDDLPVITGREDPPTVPWSVRWSAAGRQAHRQR